MLYDGLIDVQRESTEVSSPSSFYAHVHDVIRAAPPEYCRDKKYWQYPEATNSKAATRSGGKEILLNGVILGLTKHCREVKTQHKDRGRGGDGRGTTLMKWLWPNAHKRLATACDDAAVFLPSHVSLCYEAYLRYD
jgi:hypothetical protein